MGVDAKEMMLEIFGRISPWCQSSLKDMSS